MGLIRGKLPIEIMKATGEGFSVDLACKYFPDISDEEITDIKYQMKSGKIFDPEKPVKYIVYLDANNLYGWAMQPLSTGGFKWMTDEELRLPTSDRRIPEEFQSQNSLL